MPPPPGLPSGAGNWITLPGDYDLLFRLVLACPIGVVLFTAASIVIELRTRWWRRWGGAPDRHRLWVRLATACALAAASWSIANETFVTFLRSPGRQPCDPDLGWIALAGWLVAAATRGPGRRSSRA